ncbi:MAG: hypothetical protein ABI885_03025 [Gammaproteobacteria bacterium]
MCNVFGAAIIVLLVALPARADGPSAPPANNYPTIARLEYVQECINRAGGQQAAMYQCACAIDRIAERLTYDEFVEASTYAKYSTLPGEGGGIFRDTDDAKQKAKLFRSVESDAYRACNVPSPSK